MNFNTSKFVRLNVSHYVQTRRVHRRSIAYISHYDFREFKQGTILISAKQHEKGVLSERQK